MVPSWPTSSALDRAIVQIDTMPFSTPRIALVRRISRAYAACLREDASTVIDVVRAGEQHDAYVDALSDAGVEVRFVDPADELPDACFVEDTAVITGQHALLTIPGAPSRQAEGRTVAPWLAGTCDVVTMEGEARLDGGDVLRIGDRLFVGLSARSNAEGAAALAAVAALDGLTVTTVPLRAGLHLKSACTIASPSVILCDRAALGDEAISALGSTGAELLFVPEAHGANVLALGDRVLASQSAPRTIELLAGRGVRVVALELDQIHAGDGALTCLSLRVPGADAWCA
jgi:dimethylargininase